MANFKGHALPGSCFLLLGLCWSVMYPLRHCWRRHQPKARQKLPLFFNRIDLIEGTLMIFFAFVGECLPSCTYLDCSLFKILHYGISQPLNDLQEACCLTLMLSCHSVGIMAEQFVPDGPHAHLYNRETQSWVKLMNWQHSTMYLFFSIAGVVKVLTMSPLPVPLGLDRLALSLAFFIEGLLFYFHVHMRPPLDTHIHSMLFVPVFGGAAITLLEVFMRDNIVLELLRTSMTILQGSWFFQIGFVLYPLNGVQWDLQAHDNTMFITMCFCWHLAVALLIVGINYWMGWCCVQRCSGRGSDIEIMMRKTSSSKKALLEESDEE
ncbi:transmembrane protein 45B-like isoform X1 [Oncorhynchus clarkii lewisi]|uniref:transmembrane protein 45B-like isoform X1 n=1 Tax=Oncorhynchus clarkii lewisi TaxID=490388 RepID=UPI0039B91694